LVALDGVIGRSERGGEKSGGRREDRYRDRC